MTTTFGFFSDAALTIPVSIIPFQATPGVTVDVDTSFFFGSLAVGKRAFNRVNPANQLTITFEDLNLAAGVNATDFVVANSLIGLDTSIVQSLDLGLEILSGDANAVQIFVRYTSLFGFTGKDTGLQFSLPNGAEGSQ
jgi:hypothetical protein